MVKYNNLKGLEEIYFNLNTSLSIINAKNGFSMQLKKNDLAKLGEKVGVQYLSYK